MLFILKTILNRRASLMLHYSIIATIGYTDLKNLPIDLNIMVAYILLYICTFNI